MSNHGKSNQRIYLSPPSVGSAELDYVTRSLQSGWIAPVGEFIDQAEAELTQLFDRPVLLTSSGSAALELAIELLNFKKGDAILVPLCVFHGVVNVVIRSGLVPVFVAIDSSSWGMDPECLEEALAEATKNNLRVTGVLAIHNYGFPCQIQRIASFCEAHDLALIEDAAEAVGTRLNGLPLGQFGDLSILSFNGNKIITASTGGALLCRTERAREQARRLANHGKRGKFGNDPEVLVGANYQFSNVLAGILLAQLNSLQERIEKRRAIWKKYVDQLGAHIECHQQEPDGIITNRWLSAFILKYDTNGLISYLDRMGIEARACWKPLSKYDVYQQYPAIENGMADKLHKNGICLPSGHQLESGDQQRIVEHINRFKESNQNRI